MKITSRRLPFGGEGPTGRGGRLIRRKTDFSPMQGENVANKGKCHALENAWKIHILR